MMSANHARGDRVVLSIGGSADAGAVFAALSQDYTVHAEPASVVNWTWLDTADRRVRRAGQALREERRGRRRELVLDTHEQLLSTSLAGLRWPARAHDLPESAVRDTVATAVGIRALLPVAEVQTRRIPLRLMDAAGKTRVRITVDQQRLLVPRRAALPLHVVVAPLRGYGEDAGRCAQLLMAATSAEVTTLSATDAALSAAVRMPGSDGEVRHTITAADPALRPVAVALLGYVAVVDDARDGAIADLDTEFLHDLRSAIRSTRALLAAAGHLLPGRAAVRIERDLTWLDERIAPLRAIDISLLQLADDGEHGASDEPRDEQSIGLAGLAELDPLRTELRRRRRNELRRMRQSLRAPRSPAAFSTWRDELTEMIDADVIGPSAGEAARTLARAEYGRLGRTVDTLAAEEYPLHLGALRQVLLAFGDLYPGEPAAALRREVEELFELLRRRDGARILAREVRAAVSGRQPLPVASVLDAGAVVDRVAAYEARLQHRIDDAHADLTSPRGRRRLDAVTT